MKDTDNLPEPEFEPILRGVKLSRVFKSEQIGKLKYHGGCQIDEVDSTKKVKDASDENKLESDASDNLIRQQYFFLFQQKIEWPMWVHNTSVSLPDMILYPNPSSRRAENPLMALGLFLWSQMTDLVPKPEFPGLLPPMRLAPKKRLRKN
jgi:hypothetical protein